MILDSVFWRRLDTPGSDAARLLEVDDGYLVEGGATWIEADVPAHVTYRIEADRRWRTQSGRIAGWVGNHDVAIVVVRTAIGWTVNGAAIDGLGDCLDLDLGFTPATNVLAVRRLGLQPGQSAEAPAAYLETPFSSLERLAQRYECRTDTTHWYESPSAAYEAELEFQPGGFVRVYPGLWLAGN